MSSIKSISYLSAIEFKLYLRDKLSVFWTFIYPFLLLVILASFFGGKAQTLTDVDVAIAAPDRLVLGDGYLRQVEDAAIEGGLNIHFHTHPPEGKPDAGYRLVAAASPPDRNGPGDVILQARETDNDQARRLINALSMANERYARKTAGISPAYNLKIEAEREQGARLNYTLFITSGIACLTVYSICLFGFAVPIVALREAGGLKMYQVFPVRKIDYLLSFVVTRALILIVFSLIFIACSHYIYGYSVSNPLTAYGNAAILIAMAVATFLALGFLLVSYIESTSSINAIAGIINIPIMFLSDSLIPVDYFPDYLAKLLGGSPTNMFAASLRNIIYNGSLLTDEYMTVIGLSGFFALFLVLSIRRFSWNTT